MTNLNNSGYSKEEDYFYRHNRELIEERRKSLDSNRLSQANLMKDKDFWMKCPKCGVQMQETQVSGVTVDQCGGCNGVYLDNGELKLIIEAKKQESIFDSFENII